MKMRFSKLLSAMTLCLLANLADAHNYDNEFYQGHYYAMSIGENTGNAGTLCGKKNIAGVTYRINWADYEPTNGGYEHTTAWDNVLATISGLGPSVTTQGSTIYNNQCQLFMMVNVQDYDNTGGDNGNPCPSWLKDANGALEIAPTNNSASIINIDPDTATVKAVSNTTPIVITATGSKLVNGKQVFIDNVAGNTAANGFWTVANATANTFELKGSHGNGARVKSGSPLGWYGRATTGGTFVCKLWDANVATAFKAMIAHLGATYDTNLNVIGLQFQESATSTGSGGYDDTPASGGDYDAGNYTNNMVGFVDKCNVYFPTSYCMYFLNQIEGNMAGLATVGSELAMIPNYRGCYSGPDILPGDAGLMANTYQNLNKFGGRNGCRAESAQNTTIVGTPPGVNMACDPTNCDNVLLFAVQGTLGDLPKTPVSLPAPSNVGLCVNTFIFWNDSSTEQTKVDATVKKYGKNGSIPAQAGSGICAGGGTG
jgi:hypothetical protein